MSMLTAQVENLRIMARLVRDYDYREISRELREAADTIENLRNRLTETCHDLSGTGANGEQVFHCSECGCVMSLYDLDGANVLCTNHVFDYPRYCPNCGRMVI
jgi:rubrerythrin